MFFSLSSWQLWLVVFAIVGGASGLGVLGGRYLRRHSDTYREPFGVLQGALLGVVGLVLAFGLTLAVGRYENRRADLAQQCAAAVRREPQCDDRPAGGAPVRSQQSRAQCRALARAAGGRDGAWPSGPLPLGARSRV